MVVERLSASFDCGKVGNDTVGSDGVQRTVHERVRSDVRISYDFFDTDYTLLPFPAEIHNKGNCGRSGERLGGF